MTRALYAAAAFAALLICALFAAQDDPGWPAVPPPPAMHAHHPAAAPRRDDATAVLLARPLFAASRRPPDAPAPAAAEAMSAAALPRLAGTLVYEGGTRAALLVPPDPGAPFVVREGERRGALLVVRIGAGELLAEGPGGRLTLRMGAGSVPVAFAPPPPEPDAHDPRQLGPQAQDE